MALNLKQNDELSSKYDDASSKYSLRIPDIIMKKRNGNELSKEEIDFFIKCVCDLSNNNNSIEESQIGALLMAIYFRSMTYEESYRLTSAMMKSGVYFKWPKYRNRVVDKHSTGGVGDKISLALVPALAACGLKIPMISGRGLGFTGGTLDKLESIPGLTVSCSVEQIEYIIDKIGCCIVGQTLEINPADRILYANRDITSTVDCIPLIAGSIISKKAIEDLDALVLDVKIGKAAIMKNQEESELLADYMNQIARRLGVKTGVFITRHDDPLGKGIGNQIEIEEIIECLHGNIPYDLEELITKFGGYLLQRTKQVETMADGCKMILSKLKNGEALEIFKQMIIAQGVNQQVAQELCYNKNYNYVFPKRSKYISIIKANKNGYIKHIDALLLGNTASQLGAGRTKSGDKISYEVGFKLIKTIGDKISIDEPWLQVFHNSSDFEEIYAESLINSIKIVGQPFERESLIVKIIDYD